MDAEEPPKPPTKEELISMLDEMYSSIERLPTQAMYTPATQADIGSLVLLLAALFKAKD